MKRLLFIFLSVLLITAGCASFQQGEWRDVTPEEKAAFEAKEAERSDLPRPLSRAELEEMAAGAEAGAKVRAFDALTGGCATCLDSVDGDDATAGDFVITVDDSGTGNFYIHYFVNAGNCDATESSPYLIEPDSCSGDTIKGYWKLPVGFTLYPSTTPGITGRDSDQSNEEAWKLYGNAADGDDAYAYLQVREGDALVTYITLDGVNVKILLGKPLDIGANAFTVNSVEIVGSDGEVNKAAVEDSGEWDTAYSHSQATGTDPHAVAADTLTFTNKTINADGTGNSITNIENADIKAAAGIEATKLQLLKDIVTTSPITGAADNVLPGADSDLTLAITMLKDIVTTAPLTGAEDDVLPGADADLTLAITLLKDIVTTAPITGGEDDVLPGADADLTIAITQADTDNSGYLSDTDWDTFNGKLATDGSGASLSAIPLDADFTTVGRMRRTGAGAYNSFVDNWNASDAPDADDDTTGGYTVGSIWIDTTADKAYVCLDATDTAAVWTEVTQAGGGFDASGTPATDDIAQFTDVDTIKGMTYAELAAIAGYETALEAVLDLPDLQGELGTGQGASGFVIEGDVDDTPANAATTDPVSSNWAYDHTNDADQHGEYLKEADFDAQTMMMATSDDTPVAITIEVQQIVGRITAGNIKGLSIAEIKTLIGNSDTDTTGLLSDTDWDTFNDKAPAGISTVTDVDGFTMSAAQCLAGVVAYATGAGTIVMCPVLPTSSFSVIDYGGAAVVIDPDASGQEDRIILDGTLLAVGANVTSTSTTGDIIVCMYQATDVWYCISGSPDGDHWAGP